MKSRIALLILLMVSGLIAAAAYEATAYADDEAAVRYALLRSGLSFEKNDVAMAAKVCANDVSLTIF